MTNSILIQKITDNDDVLKGAPIQSASLRLYKMACKKKDYPDIPDDYWDFMARFNGLYYNGATLYGLKPEIKAFPDVLKANQNLFFNIGFDIVAIGENDMDYLIYDGDDEEFKVIAKSDETVWKHTPDFTAALECLLHLD